MPKRKREKWTSRQAAAHCGVTARTFRYYANTGRDRGVPQPIPDEFAERGERLFWADEVQRWHASRPGSGRNRTTLTPGESP